MYRVRLSSICVVAALASTVAAPAIAQSAQDSRQMTVKGSAPEVCTLDSGRIQTGGLVNVTGLDGDTLRIQNLTDPTTLATRATNATISFAAMCNFPHEVRVESENNGLWPTDQRISSPPQGFAYAVPYETTVKWDNTSGQLNADAKVRRIVEKRMTVDEASTGTLELQITIPEGASNVQVDAPVLAGDYTDTLRIYVEPR